VSFCVCEIEGVQVVVVLIIIKIINNKQNV
jgi:hypothetical protein